MTCPNSGSLQLHIGYRHLDIRPFQCALCDYSCKSKADLVRHEESHLPKSYICDVDGCDFETKTAHCLRRHIRKRHDSEIVQRYVCHICNSRYSRGFGLTKHLKRQHHFSWPSGHPRFRYIEYDDGLFRLQMVRFESAELTKRAKSNSTSQVCNDESLQDDANNENQNVPELEKSKELIAGEPVTEQVLEARNANIIHLKSAPLDPASSSNLSVNDPSASLSSKNHFYLQPKPDGYTISLQEQLLSFNDSPTFSTIEYDGLELANAIRALLPNNEVVDANCDTDSPHEIEADHVEVANNVELDSSPLTVVGDSNSSSDDSNNALTKHEDGAESNHSRKSNIEKQCHEGELDQREKSDENSNHNLSDPLMDFGTLVEKIIENSCTSTENQAEGPPLVAVNVDSVNSKVAEARDGFVDGDEGQQSVSASEEDEPNEVDYEEDDNSKPKTFEKRPRLDYDSVFTNPNPTNSNFDAETSNQDETSSASNLQPRKSPRPKFYTKRSTTYRPARHTPKSRRRIASALIERLGLQNIPYKFRFHTVDDMAQEVVIDTSKGSRVDGKAGTSGKDVVAELEFEVNDGESSTRLNSSDLDKRMDASHVLLSLQEMKGATDE